MADRTPARRETVADKFRRFYALLDDDEQATLHELLERAFSDPSGDAGVELFGATPPSASLSDIWGPPRVVPVGPHRATRRAR
jgi:hypothetical protein